MSKTKCTNCDKEIETSKFFLHERYCSLNVRKCSICNEPVQKDEYEEHKILEHPKPKCSFCQISFSNEELEEHIKNCSKKLYECQYCGLYMNKNELTEHEYQCGSKTIKCEFCGENVIKTTYDLHLEYTCEKVTKDLSSEQKNENKINDIINKNIKEKNKKGKKDKIIGNKKRKRNNVENNDDNDDLDEPKTKKKKYS